jgi:SPP1 gp7 family putative phage head morphogenesis protein
MARVLQIKPPQVPKSEEYNFKIRKPVEAAQSEFEKLVDRKLTIINQKILEYAKKRVETAQKAVAAPDFHQSDFIFDMNPLVKAMKTGIDFQKDQIVDATKNYSLPIKANIAINFNLGGYEQQILSVLQKRAVFLADKIEEVTLSNAYDVIGKGIEQGLPFSEISINLQNSLGMDGTRASKIARTETNWALNDGTRVYMQHIGISQYKISLAANACEECMQYKDEVFDVETSDVLPIHPNCRCTIISVIPDAWLQDPDNSDNTSMEVIDQKITNLKTEYLDKQSGVGVNNYFENKTNSRLNYISSHLTGEEQKQAMQNLLQQTDPSDKYYSAAQTMAKLLGVGKSYTSTSKILSQGEINEAIAKAMHEKVKESEVQKTLIKEITNIVQKSIVLPKDGVNGKDGINGLNGKDGKNGVNGKDGVNGLNGLTPRKGIDYLTDIDIANLVEETLKKMPLPKEYTPEDMRNALEALEEDERLDINSIKGFKEAWLREAKNIQLLISSKAVWGNITGDITTQADLIAYINSQAGGGNKIDINGNNSAITYFNFTPTTAPTYQRGRVWFDSSTDALSIYDAHSGTSIQVGKELVLDARNNTAATILNGSTVYISGATGQHPTIALAKADNIATCQVIGVATQDILVNGIGKVTVSGDVSDIDTSAFVDGVQVYLSATTAGQLTTTPPASPNFVVAVGVISYSNNNHGILSVRPQPVIANNDVLDSLQYAAPSQNAVKNYVNNTFVKNRVISSVAVNTNAGSVASTDYIYLASGTTAITLPTAVSNLNRYTIKNVGNNTVTINTTSSQTIDGSLTASLPVKYTSIDLISNGSNWNII